MAFPAATILTYKAASAVKSIVTPVDSTVTFPLEIYFRGRNLDIDAEVRSFRYDETLRGASTFSLHVISSDWKKWDRVATAPKGSLARLRWGIHASNDECWSRWKHVLLSDVRLRYNPSSVEALVLGVDQGFSLLERSHNFCFIEKPISDMVAEIGVKDGFREMDIQPTRRKHTFYQCGVPDGAFIQKVLLPHAVSGAGRADYNFYFRDGKTLVFQPPSLEGKTDEDFQIVVDPSSASRRDTDFVDAHYRGFFQSTDNSYSNELRGYDPWKKEPISWVADDNSVPLLHVQPGIVPDAPALPARVFRTTDATKLEDVKDEAAAQWSERARDLFRITVSIYPTTGIDVGRVVEMVVSDQGGEEHWVTGRWLVSGVTWYRSPGGHQVILELERRTMLRGGATGSW